MLLLRINCNRNTKNSQHAMVNFVKRKQGIFREKKICEFVDSEFVKIFHKQVNYNHF